MCTVLRGQGIKLQYIELEVGMWLMVLFFIKEIA